MSRPTSESPAVRPVTGSGLPIMVPGEAESKVIRAPPVVRAVIGSARHKPAPVRAATTVARRTGVFFMVQHSFVVGDDTSGDSQFGASPGQIKYAVRARTDLGSRAFPPARAMELLPQLALRANK